MWRPFAILTVCGIVVLVAVWSSTTPVLERLPDPTRAVRVPESCPSLAKLPANSDELFPQFIGHLKEFRLDCGPVNADEVYRFTWAHAFVTHHPITVTVLQTGDVVVAVTKEYGWEQSSLSFTLLSQRERQIALRDWAHVRTMLANIEFWNMEPEPVLGCDGSTWTVEGRVGRRYHRVSRWSPADSSFRRVALEMLKLGGLGNPEP